ncbi:MAG: MoaD family protein [Actinobacteria bacterium]|nr:MoaD family protein [Actinomycetota bacterium]
MPVTVRIPAVLRSVTAGKDQVAVEAADVSEVLSRLDELYPGVKDRLCDAGGKVRRFVNIYVNREDVRFLNGVGTALKEGDVVSIIPAIAGG